MLEAWLRARDEKAMRAAWATLAPVRHEFAPPNRTLTLQGAAALAEAMLGEPATWILDYRSRRPDDEASGVAQGGGVIDDAWEVGGPSSEQWSVWERRTGTRGVQVVQLACGSLEPPPEGGATLVVRVFDGDRAASVAIERRVVSTIGEVDLAPLDLFGFFRWYEYTAERTQALARSVLAQVASEVDAHYDTSAEWPVVDGVARKDFPDGERRVVLDSDRLTATVEPAPGTMIRAYLASSTSASIEGRLPNAQIDRVIARLDAMKR